MKRVLVDTNIWIDHLRKGDDLLISLLKSDEVVLHPFICGELACSRLKSRNEIVELVLCLPGAGLITDSEFYSPLDREDLFGCGLGFVDVHLLGSCLGFHCKLWTRDKALEREAKRLRVQFEG